MKWPNDHRPGPSPLARPLKQPARLPRSRRIGPILGWTRKQIADALYYCRPINRARIRAERIIRRTVIDPASIQIPLAIGEPDVSVIIPTYGKVRYTLQCLKSIAAAPPRVSLEVIVVDDASGEYDIGLLQRVEGITLWRNAENLGFLRSCNLAAKKARGTFLYFLNNDAELMPGAIDALVDLARAHPEAGAVGSKLVYPNGLLQEAGGIVWSDGSTANYGWHDDSRKPQYNYVREVDYVSGASLLVRKTIWDRLDGFDEAFAPAYYEDTDFAFRVRRAGLKVFYQPDSVVVHHEGISHRREKNAGIQAALGENRDRFVARWGAELRSEQLDPGSRGMRARDRAGQKKIALVIAPSDEAVEPVLGTFLRQGWILKLCPLRSGRPASVEALQQRGIEVLFNRFFVPPLRRPGRETADFDAVILVGQKVAARYLRNVRQRTRAKLCYYSDETSVPAAHDRTKAGLQVVGAKCKAERAELTIRSEVDFVLRSPQDIDDCLRVLGNA